jgi:hypothetical protein
MKKFIFRVFIFAFVFFVIDKLFLPVRNTMPERISDNRLERILTGDLNNKDIIILGSSRGHFDVMASDIQNHFNLNTFNLSYKGGSVAFQKFILENYINYNTHPRIIIKVLDDNFEFQNSEVRFIRKDKLSELVKHEKIRDKLIELGEKKLLLSKLFVLHQINLSFFNFNPRGVDNSIIAYGAGNRRIDSIVKGEYKKREVDFDSSKIFKEEIDAFKEIQELCAVNNIQLIFVVGPVYKEVDQKWLNYTKKKIANKKNIFVFDTIGSFYKSKGIYFDKGHLNRIGATQFTKDIIGFIEENEILGD